jgi:hypothetical protein
MDDEEFINPLHWYYAFPGWFLAALLLGIAIGCYLQKGNEWNEFWDADCRSTMFFKAIFFVGSTLLMGLVGLFVLKMLWLLPQFLYILARKLF